eukprot:TRINITY_DN505_c0_g1_i2.p1 TRINITY_DN505_c0_g1~~TRINITY_DN505_c0_g1_i2.p1  ORF type:complete len:373 (-),score=70.83 TRINITY_DN505_c0_g1_i2:1250-2368(-)
MLLLTMTEEDAFWTLCSMMEKYNLRGFFGQDVALLSTSLSQFTESIKITLPDVWEHFNNEMVDVSMFAAAWFHTLFSHDAQVEFIHRLWDIFFRDGYSIIFRTALAIVKEAKDTIQQLDMSGIVEYFKMTPRQITNPDLILSAAFKIAKNKFIHKVYTQNELQTISGPEGKKWLHRHRNSVSVAAMYKNPPPPPTSQIESNTNSTSNPNKKKIISSSNTKLDNTRKLPPIRSESQEDLKPNEPTTTTSVNNQQNVNNTTTNTNNNTNQHKNPTSSPVQRQEWKATTKPTRPALARVNSEIVGVNRSNYFTFTERRSQDAEFHTKISLRSPTRPVPPRPFHSAQTLPTITSTPTAPPPVPPPRTSTNDPQQPS